MNKDAHEKANSPNPPGRLLTMRSTGSPVMELVGVERRHKKGRNHCRGCLGAVVKLSQGHLPSVVRRKESTCFLHLPPRTLCWIIKAILRSSIDRRAISQDAFVVQILSLLVPEQTISVDSINMKKSRLGTYITLEHTKGAL